MPQFMPVDWICTADMASYHQLPRPLSSVYKELFDEELSKDAREQMAGLSVENIQKYKEIVLKNHILAATSELPDTISRRKRRV